jgi:KDO2-lipid IV(A) lauroyltransferase
MKYYLILVTLRLGAALPLPLLHAIGHLTGTLLSIIPNRLRSTTVRHIQACFPEMSRPAQRQLVRDSLIETAKTLTESGALWLRPAEQSLQLIRKVDGRERVDAALQKGRGVILATPHLGSWEAAGLYGAARFHMTCLYRPLRIRKLERLVRESRERPGAHYVTTSAAGIRALYRVLEEGGTTAMLPDQEPRAGNGIFAPFFGIPAWSGVLLTRMARRTGATVVFAWCERLPHGRGYHLHFRDAPGEIVSPDPAVATRAINEAVEQLIRECPQQYQWAYRRFKRRPDGEPPFYPDRR